MLGGVLCKMKKLILILGVLQILNFFKRDKSVFHIEITLYIEQF